MLCSARHNTMNVVGHSNVEGCAAQGKGKGERVTEKKS